MSPQTTNPAAANGESADAKADRAWRKRRAASRHGLLLAWCIWLIISWTATLATETIKIAATVMMPLSALIGLMVMWPMLRLSQQFEPRATAPDTRSRTGPGHQVGIFREWLQLNLVFQAVIWPLMLNAQWTVEQTAWLDVTIAAWSLLAALIVDWGCHSNSGWVRMAAMIGCLLLLFAEPAVMGLVNMMAAPGSPISWSMKISPLRVIWDMTRQFGAGRFQEHIPLVVAAAAAGVVGWVARSLYRRQLGGRPDRG